MCQKEQGLKLAQYGSNLSGNDLPLPAEVNQTWIRKDGRGASVVLNEDHWKIVNNVWECSKCRNTRVFATKPTSISLKKWDFNWDDKKFTCPACYKLRSKNVKNRKRHN